MLTKKKAYNFCKIVDYVESLKEGNLPNFEIIDDIFFKNMIKRMMQLKYGDRITTSELKYLLENKANNILVPAVNQHHSNINDVLKDRIEVFFSFIY
jgi:hypothetical protein